MPRPSKDDPSKTHPNTSALTTTNASGSSLDVRRTLEAKIEGLSSPLDFLSKSERQSITSSSTSTSTTTSTTMPSSSSSSSSSPPSETIPAIKTIAPDSLGPRLASKVCIITGANSPLGIGRATAHQYARHGAQAIYICDYDDTYLSTHVSELNKLYPTVKIHPVKLDVSDEPSVEKVCQSAISTYGRLDIMFANAGIVGSPSKFEHISSDDYMNTMKINALGVFLCFKHAAIAMKVTSSASKPTSGGSLIGTASVAGLRSNAGGTDYSASKAAVVSMAQTFAYQLVGTGIRANALCPGLIETGMTGVVFEMARQKGTEKKIGQLNPTRRGAVADEVARVALFLGSDEASYVNGQAWAVCGGLSAGHPFVPGKLA